MCIGIYLDHRNKQHTTNERGNEMTKAEKKAIEARAKDLVNAGVEKTLARVMAKAEFDAGLIKVVVNHN